MLKPPSPFITPNFLLLSPQAERLYHDHAKQQPIIDYHSHLPPEPVARNHGWDNLTRLWLAGDHYKWRAMRANGIAERFITGDATDAEKFQAWARTVPATLRNPLYHWTHLELQNPFGVTQLLNEDSAAAIWSTCQAQLGPTGFTARSLLAHFKVEVVCTTDDPIDSLEHHLALRRDPTATVQMRPTWRPDRGLMVDDPAGFNQWLDRLATVSSTTIRTLEDYLAATAIRHRYFHAAGCRLSDHGLDIMYADDCSGAQAAAVFSQVRAGTRPEDADSARFKSFMLDHWARLDHAAGWVQQFHLGPLRNNSRRLMDLVGADAGVDSMDDQTYARPLSRFLDCLDRDGQLAKTILYNLNPRDNEMVATMAGNFQDGSTPGKIQYGAAWWFLDQKDGIERQLDTLSNQGLLSRFVGMLTDSRSFLSYSRHDYFRRILCNRLGADMRDGLLPDDDELIGRLVEAVCYGNAKAYFSFEQTTVAGSRGRGVAGSDSIR